MFVWGKKSVLHTTQRTLTFCFIIHSWPKRNMGNSHLKKKPKTEKQDLLPPPQIPRDTPRCPHSLSKPSALPPPSSPSRSISVFVAVNPTSKPSVRGPFLDTMRRLFENNHTELAPSSVIIRDVNRSAFTISLFVCVCVCVCVL